jgi:hypothetical protein
LGFQIPWQEDFSDLRLILMGIPNTCGFTIDRPLEIRFLRFIPNHKGCILHDVLGGRSGGKNRQNPEMESLPFNASVPRKGSTYGKLKASLR